MRHTIMILGAGILLSVGCTSTKTSILACGDWLASLDAAPEVEADVVAPDVTSDVNSDESSGFPLATGSACTSDDQCFTKQCFCGEEVTPACFDLKKTAEGMGATWNYVLTGGMCSKLLCNPKKPEACGDGAFCFDVGPLFQASMVIGLCLASCQEYDDCRYQEGYVCYFTGLEGQRACLPDNIVKEIPCGNDICETVEKTDTCPRDCFCGNGSCDSGEDATSCAEDCK